MSEQLKDRSVGESMESIHSAVRQTYDADHPLSKTFDALTAWDGKSPLFGPAHEAEAAQKRLAAYQAFEALSPDDRRFLVDGRLRHDVLIQHSEERREGKYISFEENEIGDDGTDYHPIDLWVRAGLDLQSFLAVWETVRKMAVEHWDEMCVVDDDGRSVELDQDAATAA